MNFGRFAALIITLCLFFSGCSSDNVDGRAQTIIDQIPPVPGDAPVDDREGCVEVTEDDEYGIEDTYLLCDDDVAADGEIVGQGATTPGSMSPMAWTEADSAGVYADFLRSELILGGGCEVSSQDIEAGSTALSPMADGPEKAALSALVAAVARVGSSCTTAEVWLPMYKQALIALAEGGAHLANATGLSASSADEVSELMETADATTTLRAAADVYTNVAWILDGGPPDSAAHDDLWWDYSHLAVSRSMPSDVEIALVGDSQAQFGLDPYLIGQTTRRVTGNFALPGLTPMSAGSWIERFVVPIYAPEVVVIAVSEIGFVAANERACNFDQIGPLLDAQDTALAGVPLNAETTPREVFSGRGDDVLPIESPYNRAIESRFDENSVFIGFPEPTARDQENQLEARARKVAQPYCSSRTEELVALAHRLEAQGIQTLVALMPLANPLAVLWSGRPDAVIPQVEQALATGGIEVVDLRVLRPDQMVDAVHANADGQAALSAELAQAINQLVP